MAAQQENLPVCLSLGIMAWNEADSIERTLESLFRQSVFGRLAARGRRCEITVLANGCTDRTVSVASGFFERMSREHPDRRGFTAKVADIPQPGRNNAWNRFVHEFSAREASFIALMDADIVFHHLDTLAQLISALEGDSHAAVSCGRYYKDIQFKKRKSLRERVSLATSDMTGTIGGRFSGQLYCMRATVARRILLPRDLGATDDGFLKAVICSDFLNHEPDGSMIVTAPDAAHIFEPYLSVRDILNNQKRQMIGQTSVHIILEYLRVLPAEARMNLAETLRRQESRDPDWLRKKISDHVHNCRFFWQLFPGILGFRWKRLARLKGARRITHLPAALAGFVVTLIACQRAFHFLRGGGRTSYWPKATRTPSLNPGGAAQPDAQPRPSIT